MKRKKEETKGKGREREGERRGKQCEAGWREAGTKVEG